MLLQYKDFLVTIKLTLPSFFEIFSVLCLAHLLHYGLKWFLAIYSVYLSGAYFICSLVVNLTACRLTMIHISFRTLFLYVYSFALASCNYTFEFCMFHLQTLVSNSATWQLHLFCLHQCLSTHLKLLTTSFILEGLQIILSILVCTLNEGDDLAILVPIPSNKVVKRLHNTTDNVPLVPGVWCMLIFGDNRWQSTYSKISDVSGGALRASFFCTAFVSYECCSLLVSQL